MDFIDKSYYKTYSTLERDKTIISLTPLLYYLESLEISISLHYPRIHTFYSLALQFGEKNRVQIGSQLRWPYTNIRYWIIYGQGTTPHPLSPAYFIITTTTRRSPFPSGKWFPFHKFKSKTAESVIGFFSLFFYNELLTWRYYRN